MTTSPEVLELIRENQQRGEKVLDLSFKQLTEIPEAVLQLTHLEELNLYGNEIQIIPDTLRQLPLLRRLDICGNPIEQLADINGLSLDYDIFLAQRHHLTPAHIVGLRLELISDEIVNDLLSLPQLISLDLSLNRLSTLPESFGNLTQLTSLDLGENQLSTLPESFGKLTQLTSLDLRENQLSTLPESFGKLTQLTSLDLSSNQLSTLPKSFDKLTQLTSLDLSGNQLSTLPKSFDKLTQLTSLDLSLNELSTLSGAVTKLRQLTSLDLWRNQLSTLPESFGKLTQLTSLDLRRNQLSTLPESFGKLTQLTSLDLSRNQLGTLPESFGKLTQLTSLDLSGNQLSTLPKSFDKLTQLTSLSLDYDIFLVHRYHLTPAHIVSLRLDSISDEIVSNLLTLPQLTSLDLSENELSTLPESFGKLTQLTSLDLRENQLSTLPESFGKLTQLTSLYLGENELGTLPESFGKLTQLTSLDLSFNQFEVIPNNIFMLKQLSTLSFGYEYDRENETNTIKIIPRDILQLTHLEELELGGNPIENPPAEIALQGIDALWEYFAALDLGADRNTTAKLILVGNGRVGKTCISKYLAGEPFSDKEKSTHGIRVVPLHLPTHAPDLNFQVWDFGGQDIYHATHRFFLSRRALYLLIWDSDTEKRAQQPNDFGEFPLEYWLDNIAALSDNSPVLVIQNKVDDSPPLHLPQDQLAEHYQIKDFLKVSAKTGRGFEELKQQIAAQFIPPQPLHGMVNYDIPATWLKIRDQLHQLSKKHRTITYQDYLKRCQKLQINQTAAEVLCRFLHETASILYFAEVPALEHLMVLNPRWATAKIYEILDKTVEQQQGHFSLAHVQAKLQALTATEQDNFMALLEKFELCFEIADESKNYIAPQYLPRARPKTVSWEWETPQPPKFIYEYQKFIHNSVMVRFIARFGHLAQQQQYWRDGILFKQHDAIALVECHPQNKTITVHLKQDSAGQLAHQVYTNFNEINSFLSVTLFVTCCCADCENSETFHRYEVEKLQEFITEKQKMTVECPKSGHTVEIGKLVGGAVVQAWLKREDDSYPPIHKAVEKEPIEEAEPIDNTKETSPDIDMTTPAPSEENSWQKLFQETEEEKEAEKWLLARNEQGKEFGIMNFFRGILLWISSKLMALVGRKFTKRGH